jgi:tetratricopeptide (TPR) repeat protein
MFMCLISLVQVEPTPSVLAEELTDRMHQAARYLNSGDVAKAALEVQQFLEQNPTSGEAYNLLGQIKIRQTLLTQAEECFLKAIQVSPRLRDAYENLAFLELLRHKNRAAGSVAEKLLQLDPSSYNGHLIAGITSYNEGRFHDSLRYLLPLVEGEGGHDPLALAVSVEACKKLGRSDEAGRLAAALAQLKVLSKDAILAARLLHAAEFRPFVLQGLLNAQRQGGDSFELLYQLGNAYFQASQPALARQYFLEALSKRPSDLATLIQLASIEDQLGDKQAALNHFLQAKRAPKTDYPTLISYALACIQRRMFIDARRALEEAVRLQPEDVSGHYLLGVAAYSLQDFTLAENELRSALAGQPEHVAARIALGVVLLNTSRINEAADEFRAALQTDPLSGAAHYYLAQIYRRRGKTAEARVELKETIRLSPRDARAYADLAGLEIVDGRLADANTLLNKALTLDAKSAKAHYQRGILLRKEGKLDQAKEEFDLVKTLREDEDKNAVILLVTKGSKDYERALPPNQ